MWKRFHNRYEEDGYFRCLSKFFLTFTQRLVTLSRQYWLYDMNVAVQTSQNRLDAIEKEFIASGRRWQDLRPGFLNDYNCLRGAGRRESLPGT